jgi:hypothetical protein
LAPHEDPYQEIGRAEVDEEFLFDFNANVQNASKASTQAALQALLSVYATPLAIQAGVMDRERLYRLFRDYGRSLGQNPDQYLVPPSPGAESKPLITASQALALIVEGQPPSGMPAEGAQAHLQSLQALLAQDGLDLSANPASQILLQSWVSEVTRLAQAELEQQQLIAAAQQFAQAQAQAGGGQPAGPPTEPLQSPSSLGEGELSAETIERAGRGA